MRVIRAMVVLGAGVLVGMLVWGAEERVAASGPATQGVAATQGAVVPKALLDRIDKGIELLEAGKHKEFFETLAQPAMVAKVKASPEYEEIIGKVAAKSAEFLKKFKACKTGAMTLSEDGKRASFVVSEEGERITFDQVDGVWYAGS